MYDLLNKALAYSLTILCIMICITWVAWSQQQTLLPPNPLALGASQLSDMPDYKLKNIKIVDLKRPNK